MPKENLFFFLFPNGSTRLSCVLSDLLVASLCKGGKAERQALLFRMSSGRFVTKRDIRMACVVGFTTVVPALSPVLCFEFSREFSGEKPSKWQKGAFYPFNSLENSATRSLLPSLTLILSGPKTHFLDVFAHLLSFFSRLFVPLTFVEGTHARENSKKFCFSSRLFVPLHQNWKG